MPRLDAAVTYDEHLAWAKKRALAELDRPGEGLEPFGRALASMGTDLAAHPELKDHIGLKLGVMLLLTGNPRGPREWREFIEGFH